jgi:rare lipoprotein A (peptidoglycan hydrolase)
VAVISWYERDQRAGFFIARVGIAAVLSGAVAACSLNTIATSMNAPEPMASVLAIPDIAPAAYGTSAPAETFDAAVSIAAIEAAAPAPVEAAVPAVKELSEAVLRARPYRTVGKPYQIAGAWYEPKEDPNYDQSGVASWYGDDFHGRMTANGEIFDSELISAAHPTLPLPSYVKVTNLENDRSITVRVNDRGPFRHKRLIDVSEHTARLLGFHRQGMTKVRVQYVSKAPLERDAESVLLASYTGPDMKPAAPEPVMVASTAPATAPIPAPRPVAVAFAAESTPETTIATAAIESLTEDYSAGDRITMAFDVASYVQD